MNKLLTREEFDESCAADVAAGNAVITGMQVKRRGRPPKLLVSIADIKQGAHEIMEIPIQSSIAERIAHWAYRLELANAMKAGLMDSESRHDEVARQKAAIIESVITEMRAL